MFSKKRLVERFLLKALLMLFFFEPEAGTDNML